MKYPWEITTLSKSWARSSSKLNYEQASSLTEAQATAPSHAPIRSRVRWKIFLRDNPTTILHSEDTLQTTASNPGQGATGDKAGQSTVVVDEA